MSTGQQASCEISVVVIAQGEDRLSHRTLRSVQLAREAAEARGLRSELIVVLDKPSAETQAYFARWRESARVLDVAYDDRGQSRNEAVAAAQGKYVALVDATDLIGRDWLYKAYERAEQVTLPDFIAHAEVSIYFEGQSAWSCHRPSDAPGFRRAELLSKNAWTNNLFAPLSTFRKVPFQQTPAKGGFGYEVWNWICNVLASGGEVLIAPGTCQFIRSAASETENSSQDATGRLMGPSKLFDPRTTPNAIQSRSQAAIHSVRAAESSETALAALKHRLSSVPQTISRITESYPPLQKTLGAVYRRLVPKLDPQDAFPDWLLTAWREVSELEPALFPDSELLAQMVRDDACDDDSTIAFEQICRELKPFHRDVAGPMFTHIYLVPRLKRGGTDRETINYVLLVASNPENRVAVIATEEPESPWKARLPERVLFLNFCEICSSLKRKQQRELLAKLIVQLQPHVIHNIYSILGSQIYTQYGRAISSRTNLYGPAFCIEIEPDGQPLGELITFLPSHVEHLTGVVSDNQHILDYLEEKFAIDPAKLFVHYQPIVMKPCPPLRHGQPGDRLNVLWAGRLDRQKHPEIMIEIARRCEADNIHFHAYGSVVVAKDEMSVDFSASPNVTYHGEFDGLSSLPLQEYDVFLNTSQWEGLPNILLEAVGEGLPVVASNVGGVNELVIQDETGMLVTPFDNIDQYVKELRRLQAEPELRGRFILASRKLVAERHSWENFALELCRLPGYLEHPCLLERAELSRLDMPISPVPGTS
jgi:glycosyltransferase involved in cell wall biosynthesis